MLLACGQGVKPGKAAGKARLGLMTSLPIYWPEVADMGDLIGDRARPGWVRPAIEQRYDLQPLDTLNGAALAPLKRLLLAQPRPLSPQENVALDAWVRQGGELLLLADPLLTRHSQFALGDKRRPQDVALLSPILAHWGLELTFDPDQPAGEHAIDWGGAPLPVRMAGVLRPIAGAEDATCVLLASGVLAQCRIGQGRVLVLADAALLDEGSEAAIEARRIALDRLLKAAYP